MSAELDLDDVAAQSPLAQSQLAELREDAERWRWWRAQVRGERVLGSARPAYFAYPSSMDMPALGDIMKGSVAQHLDAAIDAARKDAQP